MSSQKLLRNYTSDLDIFLRDFDKKQPKKSAAQREEIEKHQQLAEMRDNAQCSNNDVDIWDEF